MKLIMAQGNPGLEYDDTRHNVGFAVIDAFASQVEASFTTKDKFHALIAEHTAGDEKILLAKPTTYYNETGKSARAIADFYKLVPEDILIIHDDLALPLGTLRTRVGGSDAGNNGIKSINSHLGEATARLRIGIHTDLADRMDSADFVLGRFTADEYKILDDRVVQVMKIIDDFIAGRLETTTHKS